MLGVPKARPAARLRTAIAAMRPRMLVPSLTAGVFTAGAPRHETCDFDGGGVGVTDFLALLAVWGACP